MSSGSDAGRAAGVVRAAAFVLLMAGPAAAQRTITVPNPFEFGELRQVPQPVR